MTAKDEVKRSARKKNSLLDLQDFLSGLLADGRIKQEDFEYVLNNRRSVKDREKHIVQYIADLHIEDQKSPGRRLDIKSLTMALSTQSRQEYFRIDPLKIDAAEVTQVMPYAFTQRHHILAVEVSTLNVKIASAQPYKEGMLSLRVSGAQKVAAGITTVNEILRVTPENRD